MYWERILAATVAIGLASAPAAAQRMDRKDRKAMEMTVEEAAATVTVQGGEDPLDPTIYLSTMEFNQKNLRGDKFLRAIYDKTSKAVGYQVYFILRGTSGFRPRSVTYLHEGELQKSEVDIIDYDVDCHRYGCVNYYQAVASLPEAAMIEFAACAEPGTDANFRLKLFGESVGGTDVVMFCTEAAALLARLAQETGYTPEGMERVVADASTGDESLPAFDPENPTGAKDIEPFDPANPTGQRSSEPFDPANPSGKKTSDPIDPEGT